MLLHFNNGIYPSPRKGAIFYKLPEKKVPIFKKPANGAHLTYANAIT